MSDGAAPAGRASPGARRQLTTVLVSQGLASGGNVTAALFAARASSADAFGAIALVLAFYIITAQLCRPFAGNVVQLKVAGSADEEGDRLARGSIVIAATLALVAAAAFAAVGTLFLAGPGRWMLFLVVALVPLLVVHDTLRLWAIAAQRPGLAVALDAAWLGLFLVALGVQLVAGASGAAILLAWAAAGGLVAAVGWAAAGRAGGGGMDLDGARYEAGHRGRVYVADAALAALSLTGFVLLLPLVSDVDEIGRLQVVEMPFGVVATFGQGLTLFLQPATRRLLRAGRPTRAWRAIGLGACSLVALSVLIGLGMWSLSEATVRDVLGPSYEKDALTIGAVVAKFAALGPVLVSSAMARSLGARRETLRFGASFALVGAAAGLALAAVSVPAGYLALYGVVVLGSFELVRRIYGRPFDEESV